ncbi:hypothetical protein V6N12_075017 [Hibiscus sabdariffa]|uniref:Uncharacterized protein n=1 Tax=Hibiscus sabdariffa TaxID=183260 RepID=A0ABR2BZF8_9ROSI
MPTSNMSHDHNNTKEKRGFGGGRRGNEKPRKRREKARHSVDLPDSSQTALVSDRLLPSTSARDDEREKDNSFEQGLGRADSAGKNELPTTPEPFETEEPR